MLLTLVLPVLAAECLPLDDYCALPVISGPRETKRSVPSENVYPVEFTVTRYGTLVGDLEVTVEEHPISTYGLTVSQTTFNYTNTNPGDVFIETVNVTIPAAVDDTLVEGGIVVTATGEGDYEDEQRLCILPDQTTVAPKGWASDGLHDWELTFEPATVIFDGRQVKEFGPGSFDQCQMAMGASIVSKQICEARYGVGSLNCGLTCPDSSCHGFFQHDKSTWTISDNAITDTVGLGKDCGEWYQCRLPLVLGQTACTISIPQTFKMQCPSGSKEPISVVGADSIGAYVDSAIIGSSSHGQQETVAYAGGLASCTCPQLP